MDENDTRIATQRHILTTLTQRFKITQSKSFQQSLHNDQEKKGQPDNDRNGLASKLGYKRYLILSNICLIMVVFKSVLCYNYVQICLKQYEFDHIKDKKPQILLECAYTLHCLQVLSRIIIEKVRSQRMQLIEKIDYSFSWQVFKILISFLLYPQPWLHYRTFDVGYTTDSGDLSTYPFKINYLLVIFSIYHSAILFIKSLILNTIYYSPRAQRIGKIYQINKHGDLYAVKCIVKDHPISAFTLVTLMMWILSTFALKIVEADVPVNNNEFHYYQNCFWFIGISLTTVGYGDTHAVSELGYIFVCMCCVWSTFNNSVVTFLLVSNLSLKQNEQKSLQLLKNIDNTLSKKKLCGQYIRITVWRLWLNKRWKMGWKQSLKQKKLKSQLNSIRIAKKRSLNANDLTQEMQNQFDNALIHVEYLNQNNQNLLDFITRNFFISDKIRILGQDGKKILKQEPKQSQIKQQQKQYICISEIINNKNEQKKIDVSKLHLKQEKVAKKAKINVDGLMMRKRNSIFYQDYQESVSKIEVKGPYIQTQSKVQQSI